MGGTFNPIHYGHLWTATEVAKRFGLEKVVFIPACLPPHKEVGEIAPAVHRKRMVELGIRDYHRFCLSTVELDRKGTSYTVDTLRLLGKDFYPEKDFFLSWG